jgi:hypothetical protein
MARLLKRTLNNACIIYGSKVVPGEPLVGSKTYPAIESYNNPAIVNDNGINDVWNGSVFRGHKRLGYWRIKCITHLGRSPNGLETN